MNTPLTASSPIPGLFQQLRFKFCTSTLSYILSCYLIYAHLLMIFILIYRIPLLGEFTCQNAIMAERFIEAGSAYVSNSSFFYYGLKKVKCH